MQRYGVQTDVIGILENGIGVEQDGNGQIMVGAVKGHGGEIISGVDRQDDQTSGFISLGYGFDRTYLVVAMKTPGGPEENKHRLPHILGEGDLLSRSEFGQVKIGGEKANHR